jgi:carbonic anhydrase
MSADWSYKNDFRWKETYPSCKENKQSPINIDSSNIAECNGLCSMSARYLPSSCNVLNNNMTPIINFDPNSFIKFKGVLYELNKMTLHMPSLHTVNELHYDMEILLYHCLNRSTCSDTGGVIISIFLQATSDDFGPINTFFNQFVNELPTQETSIEQNINVSEDWNAEVLFPNIKSFFWYEGSLPTPPCSENWTYIIFEEVQYINDNILDTLKIAFKDNIRPTQQVNARIVYYNNNTKFDDEDLYITEKLDAEIKALQEKRSNITKNIPSNSLTTITTTPQPINPLTNINPWYVKNKSYIKGILITIAMVLVLICGIKLTKYVIRSGFLIKYMENSIESKKMANTDAQIAESIVAGENQGGNNQGGENQQSQMPIYEQPR